MPCFYFDTRDGDSFFRDDIGDDLPDLEAVKKEASLFLADLAHDVLPGSLKRVLKVEVRDEWRPVLEACLVFEAVLLV
jgi:hypothetical protein